MRVASFLVPGTAALLAWACVTSDFPNDANGTVSTANDCAVIAAVAKEHYQFGLDNPPPPLKVLGESGWRPGCDWSAHGLSFTTYAESAAANAQDPRERLKWVAFGKPVYTGNGATLQTEIMHGPLAGMGYECRVLSGFAGWTVGECKMSWVS